MRTIRRSERCARVRALISQELDGELSEFAQTALRSHLRSCADCAAFSREVGVTTALLREAPLEQPARFTRVRWSADRGRSALRRLATSAAAASIAAGTAAAALALFVFAGGTRAPSTTLNAAARHISVAETQEPYREQNLLALLKREPLRGGRMRFM